MYKPHQYRNIVNIRIPVGFDDIVSRTDMQSYSRLNDNKQCQIYIKLDLQILRSRCPLDNQIRAQRLPIYATHSSGITTCSLLKTIEACTLTHPDS